MTKRVREAAGAVVTGETSFEEQLKALETVVARLESDEVPLEEAITLYEQGMQLHQACEKVLAEAQVRIEKLSKPGSVQGSGAPDDGD